MEHILAMAHGIEKRYIPWDGVPYIEGKLCNRMLVVGFSLEIRSCVHSRYHFARASQPIQLNYSTIIDTILSDPLCRPNLNATFPHSNFTSQNIFHLAI